MSEEKILDVVVVLDEQFNHEALYVDGVLKNEDGTIYACDLATATEGKPMRLRHLTVCIENEEMSFPDDLDECLKFLPKQNLGEMF